MASHLRLITNDNPWTDPRSYRPDPYELLRESQELRRIHRRQRAVTWFCVFAASFAFWTVVGVWLVAAL